MEFSFISCDQRIVLGMYTRILVSLTLSLNKESKILNATCLYLKELPILINEVKFKCFQNPDPRFCEFTHIWS